MDKIKNIEQVKRITMKPTAITKCAIGQDWYKHELVITFVPSHCYPDYMQVEEWIMNEIDGKELNIEEVVDKVYNKLTIEYEPEELHIKDFIYGNKVHFDVVVEK